MINYCPSHRVCEDLLPQQEAMNTHDMNCQGLLTGLLMLLHVPAQGLEQQDKSHGQKAIGLHSSFSITVRESCFREGKPSTQGYTALSLPQPLTPSLSSQPPVPNPASSHLLLNQIPGPSQPESRPARTLLGLHYLPKDVLGLLPGTLAWPQSVLQQEGARGGGSVAGQEGASLCTGEGPGASCKGGGI